MGSIDMVSVGSRFDGTGSPIGIGSLESFPAVGDGVITGPEGGEDLPGLGGLCSLVGLFVGLGSSSVGDGVADPPTGLFTFSLSPIGAGFANPPTGLLIFSFSPVGAGVADPPTGLLIFPFPSPPPLVGGSEGILQLGSWQKSPLGTSPVPPTAHPGTCVVSPTNRLKHVSKPAQS